MPRRKRLSPAEEAEETWQKAFGELAWHMRDPVGLDVMGALFREMESGRWDDAIGHAEAEAEADDEIPDAAIGEIARRRVSTMVLRHLTNSYIGSARRRSGHEAWRTALLLDRETGSSRADRPEDMPDYSRVARPIRCGSPSHMG